MSEPIRLNKFLAAAGVCSRRRADGLIASGRVFVSGHRVTELGCKVDPEKDKVEVEGVGLVSVAGRPLYIMLNKPVRVISSVSDPQNRKTVVDFLPREIRTQRIYPIGRLDYYSQGLILLTNDGDLAHKLTHPGFEHPKTYEIKIREKVSKEALDRMRLGMTLREGDRLAPAQVKRIPGKEQSTRLEMTITQGVNRQIRRMCRDEGLTILRLERTAHSGIVLGDLPPGKWRHLSPEEVNGLKKAGSDENRGSCPQSSGKAQD
ncbi:MAG: pseudouridine synthase [Desulfonatronovibrionaceae bacterium]